MRGARNLESVRRKVYILTLFDINKEELNDPVNSDESVFFIIGLFVNGV